MLSRDVKNARRRLMRAMRFPVNTCPGSRCAALVADAMVEHPEDWPDHYLQEPEEMALSIYSTVESLWKARTRIRELEQRLGVE